MIGKLAIYGIKNKTNNKMYIGSTSHLRDRLSQHRRDLKRNRHDSKSLQRDFNESGPDNFEFIILKYIDKIEDLEKYEEYMMNMFDVLNNKHGYNTMTKVINNSHRFRNRKYGENGFCNKDPFICIETGKIYSSRSLAADELDCRPQTVRSILSKTEPRQYVSNGYHFIKLKEIDFLFSVKDGYIQLSEQQRFDLIEKADIRRKPFICIETREIFNSQEVCAKKFGGFDTSIYCCLREGLTHSLKGFHFLYCDDKRVKDGLDIIIKQLEEEKYSKMFICIQTSMVFYSIIDAEKMLKIPSCNISSVLHRKQGGMNGYHFVYLKDLDIDKNRIEDGKILLSREEIILSYKILGYRPFYGKQFPDKIFYKLSKDAIIFFGDTRCTIYNHLSRKIKDKSTIRYFYL